MYKTISQSEFINAFTNYDRVDNFSIEGRCALYDYLEEYENETGEKIELDVIALCCEYSEYSTAVVCAAEYRYEFDKTQTAEEQEAAALEWLQNETQVIIFEKGIIIAQF